MAVITSVSLLIVVAVFTVIAVRNRRNDRRLVLTLVAAIAAAVAGALVIGVLTI